MKDTLKNIGLFVIFVFFLFFVGGFYVGAKYGDNRIGVDSLQKKIDRLQFVADSLHDENFMLNVEMGRWDVTMEWYKEENPKEAKKIEDWRSHNTE